jgi:AcrR family transcriptional regulator
MSTELKNEDADEKATAQAPQVRAKRVDAARNLRALLDAALQVFNESGFDAPVREIAERAGVGVGTFYRHFPQRADLILAVLKSQIDDCADASAALLDEYGPDEALTRWAQGYVNFILTKRGLSNALQADAATNDSLHDHFYGRLRPPLAALLEAAVAQGVIRPGYSADELLRAVATLCKAYPEGSPDETLKMVGLLIAGLRSRP